MYQFMPILAAHDASTGFHDIKALPEFSYVLPLWVWFLLVLVVALAGFFYYKLKHPKAQVEIAPPPLPPVEIATRQLRELERRRISGEIQLREFSTSLSVVLRSYLESVLHFSATDQTNREVVQHLIVVIKKCLPTLSKEKRSEITSANEEILRVCELLTFSNDSEHRFSLSESKVAELVPSGLDAINNLEHWLRKEEQRKENILGQSKLATSSLAQSSSATGSSTS